jgi:DNA-binding LacI/PurR family transcriptional regulator
METKRPILTDVAKLANVSIKTASRVVNEDLSVREETRNRVIEVIKQLKYKPNLIAKKLKINKSNTIGYIVPEFTSQFFGLIFNGIDKEMKKKGYNILVSNSNGIKENEEKYIDILISNKVEGIIFANTGLSGEYVLEQIRNYEIPFVLIDNKLKGVKMNCVLHDNIKGAEILTNHLIKVHGHKKIAFLGGPHYETSSKRRLEGYNNAFKDSGIKINDEFVKLGQWTNDSGYRLTKGLFVGKDKPTAIFISSTTMAIGVIKALKELGLRVPMDIGVVSFDSLDVCEAINPPLTTLSRVEDKIGSKAAELLLKKIKNKDLDSYDEIYIPMKMKIRQSCGCNN